LKEGYSVEEALLEAGIVRTRPILLTAAAIIVGAFVIIFDPIFNGLAIALILKSLKNKPQGLLSPFYKIRRSHV